MSFFWHFSHFAQTRNILYQANPFSMSSSRRRSPSASTVGRPCRSLVSQGAITSTSSRFCELVAHNHHAQLHGKCRVSSTSPQTLHVTLSRRGAIVDYGRLGHLMPTFKSHVVELEEKFNPTIHIEEVKVLLLPRSATSL